MSILTTDPAHSDSSNPSQGIWALSANVLKGAKQVSNAWPAQSWVDIRALKNFSVQFDGTFAGASIQLKATNHPDPNNDNTENGVSLGTAAVNASMQVFVGPYRYVRAVVTGGDNTSVLNAFLHGVA